MRHLLLLPLLFGALPALAQVEELDQVEPGKGAWQAETLGSYGGADDHQIEVIAGVTDRLVLGMRAEFEGRTHAQLRDLFQAQDRKRIELAAVEVVLKHFQNIPRGVGNPVEPGSGSRS